MWPNDGYWLGNRLATTICRLKVLPPRSSGLIAGSAYRANARSADGLYARIALMNPSCCTGRNGANGRVNDNRAMCSNYGGDTSMISSLCATRVPSANTRAASGGRRWCKDNANTARS